MASSWFDEYISSLSARDTQEKANESTYLAYAKLADYTSTLHRQSRPDQRLESEEQAEDLAPKGPGGKKGTALRGASPATGHSASSPVTGTGTGPAGAGPAGATTTAELSQLRTDLAAAQRSKAALQTQVTSLTTELKALEERYEGKSRLALKAGALNSNLQRKLKDREQELDEKARLVQSVQDEMVELELSMNVAEQKATELQKDNKELIERFMRRVGQEADEMNKQGGWSGGADTGTDGD